MLAMIPLLSGTPESRIPAAMLAASLFLSAAAGAGSTGRLMPFRDPGGCTLERVTDAAPGELHFQFEGISHDSRKFFVAWEKGKERGAYVLVIASGSRRDVPGLNNAGVFSPDDSRILVANSVADGTTELFEDELATGVMVPVAPG